MEYLIRFSQTHESFRLAETEAIAVAENIDMKVIFYDADTPFGIFRLPDEAAAKTIIRRSILAQSIHELWGQGTTLDELHASIKSNLQLCAPHATSSFKFNVDSFRGSRDPATWLALVNSFAYFPLRGRIDLRQPDVKFTLFEHWAHHAVERRLPDPERYYLGRHVGRSARDLMHEFDLKKRAYISTTSMDSELALVTANLALAAPGKLFYDPFVGTGSFPIAAARWGATVWGSDIDGKAVRGDAGSGKTVRANFAQYGLEARLGGVFTADLTNSPVRRVPLRLRGEAGGEELAEGKRLGARRMFDGIIGDPPYGVREGLKVLGVRNVEKTPWVVEKGIEMYKHPEFVPPKQPYSFLRMLDDILVFAAETLVDNGRVAFWMPTANDSAQEIPVPTHPCLEIVSVCSQVFNKWSRRLICYRRIPDSEVDQAALAEALSKEQSQKVASVPATVDELNPFRRGYFSKFVTPSPAPG